MQYFKKINQIRKHFGLTWQSLAEQLGTSKTSLIVTAKKLDREDRVNQPLGWRFALWIWEKLR